MSHMNGVSAVVTTGIYCRPGCGARPNAENVTKFRLAAAAEAAGYRACLRCRPYRSPQVVPSTAPELVCRAVRMILDGGLDGPTEEMLASRLGISARHLRRLFADHLGVTPDGLARSARAHGARRLLDDTDLSITQVAFAAGYGSLRQFNRACHEIFRASPRELRARRRVSDRLVADGGLPLRLPYEGPLDWDWMLEYFAAHAVPGVEHVSGRIYRRTVVIDGDPGVLELYPDSGDALVLVAHLPHWSELLHLVKRARQIANLDLDLDEALRALSRDPVLGPSVTKTPGRRPPGTWGPFETGIQAIIRRGRTAATARRIMGDVVQELGARVQGLESLGLTHTFPTAETVADARPSRLDLARSEQEAIGAFARAVRDDVVRLDRSISLERLTGALVGLGGIDTPTANYLALRLGELDAFPFPNQRTAEPWRPWRALAAMHLAPERVIAAADRSAA
jgi:AraC family transcriptional regulator, regulatory protein of adaptative response / DNA-3-methyladenine glycosylase II